MIWAIFAILTAGVVVAVSRPLFYGPAQAQDADADLEAYRLQLAELDRDQNAGVIGAEEAAQTRAEISRRLLKAARRAKNAAGDLSTPFTYGSGIFAGLAAFVAIGGLVLYLQFGNPGLPDQPLEVRLNAPPEQQPLEIQIANVERRLRANPKDVNGWQVIAPVYLRIGEYEKAVEAYKRVIALSGPSEEKILALGEALTFANNGVIGEAALAIFNEALKINPKSLRGRFWLALYAEQQGRAAEAEATYNQILSEDVAEAWKGAARQRLAALARGEKPSGENSNASSSQTTDGDQNAMIRGMVEKLAARLKENGNDLEGWLMLIRSYVVLNEAEKAKDAVASARAQFKNDTQALERIEAFARSLNMKTGSLERSVWLA